MNEFGLIQLINCPTRTGQNRASVLDLILTNANNVLRAGCLSRTSSDHYQVYLIKKRGKVVPDRIEIRKRKMVNYDSDTLAQLLMDIDWSILDLLHNVDEMWNMVYKGIIYELDIMCPYTFKERSSFVV